MPPVPKVTFVRPGCTQPWPTSEPCWSPMIAAIGGAPSRATASPTAPQESTIVGQRATGGMRSASSTRSDQSCARLVQQPGDAPRWCDPSRGAAPPDSVHASQVSTVPKHRSRLRSGSWVLSSAASLVADWLGARRMPCSAAMVRQSNTVRRSCQPMAGADRLAGLAIPQHRRGPLVGDPDGVDRPSGGPRRAGHLEHGGRQLGGVELDQAREGCRGRQGAVVDVGHRRRRAARRPARTPLVPTSMTSTRHRRRRPLGEQRRSRAAPRPSPPSARAGGWRSPGSS